jgi:large subunit ribosomal protein L29
MKASELRNLSQEELVQKYNSLRGELFNLRAEMKAGRIEKPHKLRELRRDIARIKTVIRQHK